MRLALKIFIASLVVILAGCSVTPEMHAHNMLQKAGASMAAGDLASAHGYIASAIDTPGQQGQVVKFFADKPERRETYYRAMAYHIDLQLSTPEQATRAMRHISQAEHLLYLSPAEVRSLRAQLIARAQQGNTSGSIGFMLRDDTTGLGLDGTKHKDIMLKRSLATARGALDAHDRQTAALMAYAATPKTPQAHKKEIERSLDEIPITRHEMEQFVRPVFPKYAERQLANMTLKAELAYSGGDRLAREDLVHMLREKIRGVEWLPYGSTSSTVVRVERLRYHERAQRPHTEIIRYNRSQIIPYSITRDMPERATYSYRYTRSPISIEYGFEIKVLVNGKVVHDAIVRGTERAENARCSDAVIHLPDGRIRPTEAQANNDMRRRCGSTSSSSMETLRRRIDNKIADAVLDAAPIARIHHLNS